MSNEKSSKKSGKNGANPAPDPAKDVTNSQSAQAAQSGVDTAATPASGQTAPAKGPSGVNVKPLKASKPPAPKGSKLMDNGDPATLEALIECATIAGIALKIETHPLASGHSLKITANHSEDGKTRHFSAEVEPTMDGISKFASAVDEAFG